jgi:hypothetical protein
VDTTDDNDNTDRLLRKDKKFDETFDRNWLPEISFLEII